MENDVHLVELKSGPPYVCPLLKTSRKEKLDNISKKTHSFDINKAKQIFNILLKDKK